MDEKTQKLIKSRHVTVLHNLHINVEYMFVRDMTFISSGNIYSILRVLVDYGLVSRCLKRSPDGFKGRLIQAYRITEKGKDYVKNKRWRLF